MLHWQQKNGGSRTSFWRGMGAVSLLVHAAVAVACVVYTYRSGRHVVTVHQIIDLRSARIVLRDVPRHATGSSGGVLKPVRSAKASAVSTGLVSTTQTAKKQLPQTIRKKKSVDIDKRQQKKKSNQLLKKTRVKKNTMPKQKPPEPVAKPDTVQPPVPPEKPIDTMPDAATAQAGEQQPIAPLEISYADAKAAERYQEIYTQLRDHWRPPPGVSDDCACQLSVAIDSTGRVQDLDIQHGSGVLLFDMAARSAAGALEWPQWMWGSSILITFKP